MSSMLTVRELCERYGVGEHTVLGWINRGELLAINVGGRLGARKPRWRVSPEALAAFELARTPVPSAPRMRRRKRPAGIIQFYK